MNSGGRGGDGSGSGSGSGSGDNESAAGANGGSFAELMGETRPVKGAKELAPPSQPSRARRRAPHDGDDPAPTGFRWPDASQTRLAAADGVNDRQLLDLRRGIPAAEERIDLHGLRADAAGRILAQRIDSASSRGLRCVLVVHGKGTGDGTRSGGGESILRDRLPDWLTKRPIARNVLAIAPAPREQGGDGATLVLLRRSP